MKTYKFLILLGLGLALSPSLSAQNNPSKLKSAPSDAPSGFTYDFDKTRSLLIDYQINPGKHNNDVAELVKSKDFPKLQKNQSADAAYYDKVRIWMEANPSKIITTLKHREDIVRPF